LGERLFLENSNQAHFPYFCNYGWETNQNDYLQVFELQLRVAHYINKKLLTFDSQHSRIINDVQVNATCLFDISSIPFPLNFRKRFSMKQNLRFQIITFLGVKHQRRNSTKINVCRFNLKIEFVVQSQICLHLTCSSPHKKLYLVSVE